MKKTIPLLAIIVGCSNEGAEQNYEPLDHQTQQYSVIHQVADHLYCDTQSIERMFSDPNLSESATYLLSILEVEE